MADNNFGTYIKRILGDIHAGKKLSTPVKAYLSNLCIHFTKCIADLSNSLMRTGKKTTVSQDVIRECALIYFDDTLGEEATLFANKAVETYNENKTTKEKQSVAHKAGLILPPTKVHHHFKLYSNGGRHSADSRIFMSAVLECIVRRILKQATVCMLESKRTTLSLDDVTETIFKDKPIYDVVSRITNLLPEKYDINPFLSFEQPKTKKEQKDTKRPKPVVEDVTVPENSSLTKMSKSTVKRLGYRAGLRRFGDQVTFRCLLELYENVEKVVKYCLVSMSYNGRKTISEKDIQFALDVIERGCIITPVKKVQLIPKKTVRERKGRTAKTQATKTKEWKKKVMYYQSMADHLFFARDSFRRLIKDASGDRIYEEDDDTKSMIGVEQIPNLNQYALDMIQIYCERQLVSKLRKANNIAVYNERQTVQKEDVYVAFRW